MLAKKRVSHVSGWLLGRLPARYPLAALLGRDYGLRSVLFHDVCDSVSSYTDGLAVTISRKEFEAKIRFLANNYTPVVLDEVLDASATKPLPARPVMVTFDDAYASVAEHAAPICKKYGIRPIFFVNAGLIGNDDLGIDNLLSYVNAVEGASRINGVAKKVFGRPTDNPDLASFICEFLPTLSIEQRALFRSALVETTKIVSKDLARQAKLYVTAEQLRSVAADGFEIGSHTYSHVHCRILSGSDYVREIDENKSILEEATGRPVRAFSLPYGSRKDLSTELLRRLKKSGHLAAFLVESRANTRQASPYSLNRVSIGAGSESQTFTDLEIYPRLRSLKDRISS